MSTYVVSDLSFPGVKGCVTTKWCHFLNSTLQLYCWLFSFSEEILWHILCIVIWPKKSWYWCPAVISTHDKTYLTLFNISIHPPLQAKYTDTKKNPFLSGMGLCKTSQTSMLRVYWGAQPSERTFITFNIALASAPFIGWLMQDL